MAGQGEQTGNGSRHVARLTHQLSDRCPAGDHESNDDQPKPLPIGRPISSRDSRDPCAHGPAAAVVNRSSAACGQVEHHVRGRIQHHGRADRTQRPQTDRAPRPRAERPPRPRPHPATRPGLNRSGSRWHAGAGSASRSRTITCRAKLRAAVACQIGMRSPSRPSSSRLTTGAAGVNTFTSRAMASCLFTATTTSR